ncbi:MAG: iron-sulfur cluster assembly accessory protein [Elusimicrobia bacterium]|nr:MAG: iron-sulfur cluster assembly accessory protein [Elusimicrobiota bacterium]
MVTLTNNAVKKVEEFFANEDDAKGKSLRVGVSPGGCSGYEYAFTFDDKKDGDTSIDLPNFTVLIDPQSAPFLQGSEIDYDETATGAGFKIKNPNVKSSCGCGQSNQF